MQFSESPRNALSRNKDETDLDNRSESANEGNDVVVRDEVKGKPAAVDNEGGREQKIEDGQAKVLEEEKERWLKGICDWMVKDMDDTVICRNVLCQRNTD